MVRAVAGLALMASLAACGRGGAGAPPPDVSNNGTGYLIGVVVSGLTQGADLFLVNNGGDEMHVTADGGYGFANTLRDKTGYNVTVQQQPPGQVCQVSNGSGTVSGANVTNILVQCSAAAYKVGMTVSGLLAGTTVVLQDNLADNLAVGGNGAISFATPVPNGATYSVSVATQPLGQTCTLTNASGTIAGADVSNVQVFCSPNAYNIGVTVSGLNGGGILVLRDNGASPLTVTANGDAVFGLPVNAGNTYLVSVQTQPAGQTCTVSNGSGPVVAADVLHIPVSCAPTQYKVNVSVSGLGIGKQAVLRNNGGDDLTVTSNGVASFAGTLVSGASYAVTVASGPATGQVCTLGNPTGTVQGGDVHSVTLTCTGAWTWVGGAQYTNSAPVYGGATPSPGARYAAATATDQQGNLWLFGGEGPDVNGTDGDLADLWEYRVSDGTWILIGGPTVQGAAPAVGATPWPGSRRAAAAWMDASGNFWLYGGNGTGSDTVGYLGDLWVYSTLTGHWTWVDGALEANAVVDYINGFPGGRMSAATVMDANGVLWVFGGYGDDATLNSTIFGDLWKYDPKQANAHWTWVGGSTVGRNSGVYPRPGVAGFPGSRLDATAFADANGNIYVFGGVGYAAGPTEGLLNDLWMYSPGANSWSWISGQAYVDAPGQYGTQGATTGSGAPGARSGAKGVRDAAGNLWLFGGFAHDSTPATVGYANDLWEYRADLNVWVWMGGSNTAFGPSSYGVFGVPGASNQPGSRTNVAMGIDTQGNIRVFGGLGLDVGNDPQVSGTLNDLWLYTVSP